MPKSLIEDFVISRIRQAILTRENLEEIVGLVKEVVDQSFEQDRDRLELIRAEISDVDNRPSKLYDALETGEFSSKDLAPRIKALLQKKDGLHDAGAEAEKALRNRTVGLPDADRVLHYASDLKSLQANSSIVEQRTFLKSFVQRVVIAELK